MVSEGQFVCFFIREEKWGISKSKAEISFQSSLLLIDDSIVALPDSTFFYNKNKTFWKAYIEIFGLVAK